MVKHLGKRFATASAQSETFVSKVEKNLLSPASHNNASRQRGAVSSGNLRELEARSGRSAVEAQQAVAEVDFKLAGGRAVSGRQRIQPAIHRRHHAELEHQRHLLGSRVLRHSHPPPQLIHRQPRLLA